MRATVPPEPPPEPPRETTFGDLTLIERIAVGGRAEVFRAREPRAVGEPRAIVVKRMLPHIAREPGAARMFEAEAELGSRVVHPNVVGVLGHGMVEGTPYLSLELVLGVDLFRFSRWLGQQARTLPLELALFVAGELLAGLDAVHEAADEGDAPLGIVHGDVSPSNVLLSIHGDVKLADFGIARARLRSTFPQAASGRMRGKLPYLAPEQVRGDPHDRRADVFAAAAVASELVIGEPLFIRDTELSTLLAVRDARIDRLTARRPLLPPRLFEALARGLARDPAERFSTAAALRDALGALAHEREVLRERLGALVAAASSQLVCDPQPFAREDVTIEPPLSDHWVRTQDGREHGPWTFARLIEAITVGRLGPDDETRIDGGTWRRLADLEGLADHFPTARLEARRRETEPAPKAALDLSGGAIVEALARSAAARESGVWVCRRGNARKEIYLVNGTPEFVTSNVPSELLGEFLVARGALGRTELDMALAVLPRFDGRLGDTLAALGLMEPVHLFRHIAEQVREKLLDLFLWTDGTAHFTAGVGPPQRGFPLGLDAWRILLEGVERRLAEGLEQDTFAKHITDDLAPGSARAPEGLPAEIEQLQLVVSRRRSLQEVVDALEDPGDRDVHRPYRTVRVGLALGLIRWA